MKKSRKSIKAKIQSESRPRLDSKIVVKKKRIGVRDIAKKIRPLNDTEKIRLDKALRKIEKGFIYGEGLNRIDGGFANAKMTDSDKETIDVTLTWGVKNDKVDYSYPRNIVLDRKTMEIVKDDKMEKGGEVDGKYQVNDHGDKPSDYKILCRIIRMGGKDVQVCYHERNDKKAVGVEVYSGKNYIVGSNDVSYSKKYDELSDVPVKYKNVVDDLVQAHHKKWDCGCSMAKGGRTHKDKYGKLIGYIVYRGDTRYLDKEGKWTRNKKEAKIFKDAKEAWNVSDNTEYSTGVEVLYEKDLGSMATGGGITISKLDAGNKYKYLHGRSIVEYLRPSEYTKGDFVFRDEDGKTIIINESELSTSLAERKYSGGSMASGGCIDKEKFPLGEQQRLIEMFLNNNKNKGKAISELEEFVNIYSKKPNELSFGKPHSYYAMQYQKAIDFINNYQPIANQYEGKTAEEVWSMWTPKQKSDFLQDHFSTEDGPTRIGKTFDADLAIKQDWKDLPQAVKYEMRNHVHDGQYDKGGKLSTIEQKAVDFLKENKDIDDEEFFELFSKEFKKEKGVVLETGGGIQVGIVPVDKKHVIGVGMENVVLYTSNSDMDPYDIFYDEDTEYKSLYEAYAKGGRTKASLGVSVVINYDDDRNEFKDIAKKYNGKYNGMQNAGAMIEQNFRFNTIEDAVEFKKVVSKDLPKGDVYFDEGYSSKGSMAYGGVIGEKRAQDIIKHVLADAKRENVSLPHLEKFVKEGAKAGTLLEAYGEFKKNVNNGGNPKSLRLNYEDSNKFSDYIQSYFPNKTQREMLGYYGNDLVQANFPNYAKGGNLKDIPVLKKDATWKEVKDYLVWLGKSPYQYHIDDDPKDVFDDKEVARILSANSDIMWKFSEDGGKGTKLWDVYYPATGGDEGIQERLGMIEE